MSVVSCRSIDDFAYPVFREYSSLGHCIHIFNTEYRIHKAMESIEQDDIAKKKIQSGNYSSHSFGSRKRPVR